MQTAVPRDLLFFENLTVSSEVEDLGEFFKMYNGMANEELDRIVSFTGCVKPCQYKEYNLVWERRRLAIGTPDIYFQFADGEVMIVSSR